VIRGGGWAGSSSFNLANSSCRFGAGGSVKDLSLFCWSS
jgi:hypothetical protein